MNIAQGAFLFLVFTVTPSLILWRLTDAVGGLVFAGISLAAWAIAALVMLALAALG